MKIRKEITEVIEADVDMSMPLFFIFSTGNILYKFIEVNGKCITTRISKTFGLNISVTEISGFEYKILAGQDKDFSATTADVYYSILNAAVNEFLPLSAEVLELSPANESLCLQEMDEEAAKMNLLTHKKR